MCGISRILFGGGIDDRFIERFLIVVCLFYIFMRKKEFILFIDISVFG